jgi:phage protein D
MAKKWEIIQGATGEKNTLIINGRVENSTQAQAKATSTLKEKNRDKVTGSFSIPGNVKMVAGININLTGIGAFDGKWQIVSSTHTIDTSGGYVTDVEVRKLIDN